MNNTAQYSITLCVISIILLIGALVYIYLNYTDLEERHTILQNEFRLSQNTLAQRDAQILNLDAMITMVQQEFALSEENRAELSNMLDAERNRNTDFANQINNISGTVTKLDKLAQTDPRLLQKYSKVYFLNEHYTPGLVVPIDEKFSLRTQDPEYISAQVWPFLQNLLRDAEDDGIKLLVLSGYRSYEEQRGIKSAYTIQYGSGANAFSAEQGYSEHQLGTTVDFTTPSLNGGLIGFQNTEAYAWLLENAHRYGFILSYPENNQYYIFEPWHWRFVGRDLAQYLHKNKTTFYTLEQRKIDEFLISFFD